MGYAIFFFLGGGAIREGYRFQTWSKNPIMAPFSVYLSPDMSADASPDALAIINISNLFSDRKSLARVPSLK